MSQVDIQDNSLFSFGSFLEPENLTREQRIDRDLRIFLSTRLTSAFFDRSSGNALYNLENSANNAITDIFAILAITEMITAYNNSVTDTDYLIISGAPFIEIEREGNRINIEIKYVPANQITSDSVRSISLAIGGT